MIYLAWCKHFGFKIHQAVFVLCLGFVSVPLCCLHNQSFKYENQLNEEFLLAGFYHNKHCLSQPFSVVHLILGSLISTNIYSCMHFNVIYSAVQNCLFYLNHFLNDISGFMKQNFKKLSLFTVLFFILMYIIVKSYVY